MKVKISKTSNQCKEMISNSNLQNLKMGKSYLILSDVNVHESYSPNTKCSIFFSGTEWSVKRKFELTLVSLLDHGCSIKRAESQFSNRERTRNKMFILRCNKSADKMKEFLDGMCM